MTIFPNGTTAAILLCVAVPLHDGKLKDQLFIKIDAACQALNMILVHILST